MDIKIFVACDKDSYVPDNPFLFPIQVGSALSKDRYVDMLHDDVGDNISWKNRSYCELTALYWMWKNQNCDYYGLFHYRRYMCFDEALKEDEMKLCNIMRNNITDEVLKELNITKEGILKYCENNDVITVRQRNVEDIVVRKEIVPLHSIYEEYGMSVNQHIEDLDITLEVMKEKYPEFMDSAKSYLQSTKAYDCNMFMMKKELFQSYCEWLFSILFEVEKRIDTKHYSVQQNRVFGYLGERLCGIYITYLKQQGKYKIQELPKVLFKNAKNDLSVHPIKDDEVTVLLHINKKQLPMMAVTLESIIHHVDDSEFYDFLILHSDLENQDKELMERNYNRENIKLQFIDENIKFDDVDDGTSQMRCLKDILQNFHKVIVVNGDFIFNADISKICEINIGDSVIGAVKDIVHSGILNLDLYHRKEYVKDTLGLTDPYDYYQTDMMLVNVDALKQLNTDEDSVEMTTQDYWNQKCENHIFELNQRWNVVMKWDSFSLHESRQEFISSAEKDLFYDYNQARNKLEVINYNSYQKPWEYVDCDLAEYFWKYARNSVLYELLLTLHKKSMYYEYQTVKEPNTVTPISRKQRIMKYVIEHGISSAILLFFSRLYKRIKKKYVIDSNGERRYY